MTQVVAGVNYFVKVKVGEGDEYAFLRIYDRFGDVQLTPFQLGKTATDPNASSEERAVLFVSISLCRACVVW